MRAETIERAKQAQARVAGGEALKDVIADMKMGIATYYKGVREARRMERSIEATTQRRSRKKQLTFVDMPLATPEQGRIAVVICTPDTLKSVLTGAHL